MRTGQRKARLVVIEPGHVLPIVETVAGLAAGDAAIRAPLCHLLSELSAMNIFVAGGAREIGKMIRNLSLRSALRGLVALHAGYGDVRSGQGKPRLLVPDQSKCGRSKGLHSVAGFTPVRERRRGELAAMLVLMTVGALRELDFELCCHSGRNVAPGALHAGMRALKRIGTCRMVLHAEPGRFPTVNDVAGLALVAVFALGELPAVRIGFVTVRAERVRQRLLEVPAVVAGATIDRAMLPQQRKRRLGMVELRTHARR